jgi:hypothetical protein
MSCSCRVVEVRFGLGCLSGDDVSPHRVTVFPALDGLRASLEDATGKGRSLDPDGALDPELGKNLVGNPRQNLVGSDHVSERGDHGVIVDALADEVVARLPDDAVHGWAMRADRAAGDVQCVNEKIGHGPVTFL